MLQSSVTTGKKEGKREKRARIVYLNFTIKFGFHNIFTFRSFDGAPASKFACMSAHVCVCVCVFVRDFLDFFLVGLSFRSLGGYFVSRPSLSRHFMPKTRGRLQILGGARLQ